MERNWMELNCVAFEMCCSFTHSLTHSFRIGCKSIGRRGREKKSCWICVESNWHDKILTRQQKLASKITHSQLSSRIATEAWMLPSPTPSTMNSKNCRRILEKRYASFSSFANSICMFVQVFAFAPRSDSFFSLSLSPDGCCLSIVEFHWWRWYALVQFVNNSLLCDAHMIWSPTRHTHTQKTVSKYIETILTYSNSIK